MKLTHDVVLERIWKNRCCPFLIMGFAIPLFCMMMCLFHFVGLIMAAGVFVLFFALFLYGYQEYLKGKHKQYTIYRQACTSAYSVTNMVDGDSVKTVYSVFGDVGEYKHKGTDTHMPTITQGKVYYLVVLQGSRKISAIYDTDSYEIDAGVFASEDQYSYTPI